MARGKSKTTSTPVWPDDRFKSETPGKAFTAYAERPFDPVWGIEQWGYEIHGQRGPQPFNRTDEHGDLVKAKGPDGRDIVQERFPDGNCNYEYETELRDVAVLTGTGPGRGTRHIEANAPDWKLPAGLTLRPPFSEAGQSMLKELGLARRHSDTFEPLPDVLRAALLTTCHVATEMLSNLTGSQIETILRQHKAALGLTSETPAGALPVNEGQMSGEARAVGVLAQHPDWTDKQVARAAGVHPKSLYRYQRFKIARGALKDSGQGDLPRGFKTEDGVIEAYE